MSTWPYDLTASFYDEDMGRNASGQDIDWYLASAVDITRAIGGPILELGSGTGRVTLPLLSAGLDIVAIDRSVPMLEKLAEKAAATALRGQLRLAASDMGELAVDGQFAAILCPFSAFCYVVDESARTRLLEDVLRQLKPGGRFMLDTFIPDPGIRSIPQGVEIVDYERPLPPGPWSPAVTIARSKTIALDVHPGVNRIKRRYRFADVSGAVLQEIETESLQHPYAPEHLGRILRESGFADVVMYGDFDPARPAAHPARMACTIASRPQ